MIYSSPLYYYQAFGLTIASELPCPELAPGEGAADVTILYGAVPEDMATSQPQGDYYQVNPETFFLKLNTIAKFLVTAGEQIIVERVPGAQDNEVRLFLLGMVFAALLHQRCLWPMHACALAVNGGAAVFLGASGSGKSTLAAALHKRGYRILADDLCTLFFSDEGLPWIYSGYPQLKLWADALQGLGENPEGLPRIAFKTDKYALPLGEGFSSRPRPIYKVYELTVDNSPDLSLTRLAGLEKLTVFLQNTSLRFLLEASRRKSHFAACSRAARHCQVGRLVRPRTPLRVEELADLVEKDWV